MHNELLSWEHLLCVHQYFFLVVCFLLTLGDAVVVVMTLRVLSAPSVDIFSIGMKYVGEKFTSMFPLYSFIIIRWYWIGLYIMSVFGEL